MESFVAYCELVTACLNPKLHIRKTGSGRIIMNRYKKNKRHLSVQIVKLNNN